MNSVKILLVEDDPVLSESLALTLVEQGYIVTGRVASGEEAVDLQRVVPAELVLMDIHLSERELNGIQTAQKLRSLGYPFRLIFITTDETDKVFSKAKITRPNAYLVKPFNLLTILRAIEVALTHELTLVDPPSFVFFPDGGGRYLRLDIQDIIYLKAERSSTSVYSLVQNDIKRMVVSKNSSDVYQRLRAPSFIVRVHRSYYINVNFISSFDSRCVYLSNTVIPVSESYRLSLKMALGILDQS